MCCAHGHAIAAAAGALHGVRDVLAPLRLLSLLSISFSINRELSSRAVALVPDIFDRRPRRVQLL